MGMPHEKCLPARAAAASFIVLSLLLILPHFLKDYRVGHDILYHLNWNALFQKQFFQGDLYPRWLFEMNGGRGSPVFYFYSPLPYYVSAIFSLIITGAKISWFSLGACHIFALTVSCCGMFRLLRFYTSVKTAYLITLFYLLFPYHLIVDLYMRFAFAEFFAIAIIPYLFIYTYQLAQYEPHAAVKLGTAYCLLILSHIPSALLISPFLMLYFWASSRTLSDGYRIISPLSLGTGLAAFYLVPVFFLRDYISLARMTEGRGYFENAFLTVGGKLFPGWTHYWAMLHYLAIVSLILSLLSFAILTRPRPLWCFLHLSCIGSIFMMYPLAEPVWRAFPLLQIVQFPWRFFIVLSFMLFLSLALSLDFARFGSDSPYRFQRNLRTIVLFSLIGLSAATAFSIYIYASQTVSAEEKAYIDNAVSTRVGANEYLPRGVPEKTVGEVIDRTLLNIDHLFEFPQEETFHYKLKQDSVFLDLTTKQTGRLVFNQFYFPTWQCLDLANGTEKEIIMTNEGVMAVELSTGPHRLVFQHQTTVYEIIGNTISLLSIVLLVILINVKRLHKGRRAA